MTSAEMMLYIFFPLAGYLLGSIPFAWVIGRIKGVDIRTVGSKNIGATNLGRTLGARFFWYAFLLDAAKGFFPVLLASLLASRGYYIELGPDMRPIPPQSLFGASSLHPVFGIMHLQFPAWAPLVTGIACVVGHLFPLYLKFKGGKGVATGFGCVLGFWPIYTLAGLLAGAFFVCMLMLYRTISLASMTAAVAFAIFVAIIGAWQNPYINTYLATPNRMPLIGVASLFAVLIVYRHRANIGRLMKGTEPQIGQREIDKARMNKP